jgi:hypothetical protein
VRRWRVLAGRPLMAAAAARNRAGDGACGGEERVWERGRVKGQPQGSLGRLYRAERGGEGHRPKKKWPSMPWRRPVLMTVKGEGS